MTPRFAPEGFTRYSPRQYKAFSAEVDASGAVTMLSHLKIAEGGGDLAPRIYFYDDTGGSTGKQYLAGALNSHHIFQEIADLSSFLFERRKLPALPATVKSALGFAH